MDYQEVKLEGSYGLDDPMLLTAVLRATFGASVLGVGVHGRGIHVIRVYLAPGVTQDAQDQVLAALNAFDPVLLSTSKTVLLANGIDSATVTVYAPRPGAAAVTLQYYADGVLFGEQLITIVAGVGTDTVTALDPSIITVSVKTPANRSTDTLTIKAS